jgi:crossover junction endodeoxyribonuclease RuvC
MAERVLCIDPALRNAGYAVLEAAHPPGPGMRLPPGVKPIRTLAFGVIRNPVKLSQSGCLVAIRNALKEVISEFKPTICAMESVIYVQSYKTAIILGAARGAAILAAAEAGLTIYEYPPKRVKLAVVGKGTAHKEQVSFMVRSLLGLTETPPHDAADALAIGITHLQASAAPQGVQRMGSQV